VDSGLLIGRKLIADGAMEDLQRLSIDMAVSGDQTARVRELYSRAIGSY
jgi:hypothetical protein